MPRALRRLLAWTVVLFGAFLLFTGLVQLAVGPEMDVAKEALDPSEAGSRWWGLLYLMLGAGVVWAGMRIDRTPPAASAPDQR